MCDSGVILKGEIRCRSLLGVKGLTNRFLVLCVCSVIDHKWCSQVGHWCSSSLFHFPNIFFLICEFLSNLLWFYTFFIKGMFQATCRISFNFFLSYLDSFPVICCFEEWSRLYSIKSRIHDEFRKHNPPGRTSFPISFWGKTSSPHPFPCPVTDCSIIYSFLN